MKYFLYTVHIHVTKKKLAQKGIRLIYIHFSILHNVLLAVANLEVTIEPKRQNHTSFAEHFKYHSTLKKTILQTLTVPIIKLFWDYITLQIYPKQPTIPISINVNLPQPI